MTLFAWHGHLFVAAKTDGAMKAAAHRGATLLFPPLLLLVAGFVALSYARTPLFVNHLAHPALLLLPGLSVLCLALAFAARRADSDWAAWGLSCAGIALFAATGVAGMFPYLLRSTYDPAAGVTAAAAASTPATLTLMLAVVLLLVPIVIAYQTWAYFFFRGRTGETGEVY